MIRIITLICLSLGCAAQNPAHAEETSAYKISRDPFIVPKFVIAATAPPSPAVKEKPEAEILFRSMNLRAAVSAGRNSLVNVDGKIIAMGEKHEGYKLVKVGNGEAVFESNGVRQTLKIERESK